MRFTWIFIIFFLTPGKECLGQTKRAAKFYRKGITEIFSQDKNLERAESHFLTAIRISPDYSDAYMALGDMYSRTGKIDQALTNYRIGAESGSEREGYFKLGKTAIKAGYYSIASEAFSSYLLINKLPKTKRQVAMKLLENSKFGSWAMLNPNDVKPIRIDQSSKAKKTEVRGNEIVLNFVKKDHVYPESYFFPSISGDDSTLYFTGRNILRPPFDENIYSVKRIDNHQWSRPIMVPGMINTRLNEGAVSVQGDQKKMALAACDREDGFGSCDIYISSSSSSVWSKPRNIGIEINTSQWETQPCLSADGQYLFFVRDAKKRGSNSNIWMSRWNGIDWSKAEMLSAQVNGSGDEFSPFLHADGKTLYFASNSHTGMGGLDLFKTTWRKDGTWSIPENLGYPINDHRDNFGLVVSPDGSTGYLAGGYLNIGGESLANNNPQIYFFSMPPSIKPERSLWLETWAFDSITGMVVNNSFWSISKNGLEKESLGAGGVFETPFSLGSEMAFNVIAENYNMVSKRIFTDSLNLDILIDTIFMTPIKNGDSFILNNILFEFDRTTLLKKSRLEIAKIVQWMTTNPELNIELQGHTDNLGSVKYNKELSTKRAQAVYQELINNGISPNRLSYLGLGDQIPVASNKTESGRLLNRRTVIQVTKF
jgi:outer membrane protein OmpA-like peptidoglycan-associated protein/Tol biopolymer transport system component